ncbi:MAG: Amidohydrolase [Dehalococcoidales bacterium]|nr:Amidohydrolase [Dehalococcoidales bacterium]
MIIDFHTHIFPPWLEKNRSKYVDADPLFATMYSSPKARLATADELVASMDNHGVDVSVALNIAWSNTELCVETNNYILESITRYPKRLIGFCSVPPGSPEGALKEIERCSKQGIKGVGEIRPEAPWLTTGNLGIMKPIIETIMRHNLILLTHASEPVGHQYPGKGDITPEVLYPLITGYPDLILVCAHWGGGLPFYALMPEVKRAMSNVFVDTAASPYLYSPQVYRQVVQMIGDDKILFGSDYPLLTPGRLLKEIKSLELPAETERLILSGNARRLLGIKADSRS